MSSKELRPVVHLRAISHKYPEAWKQLESFRADRGKDDLPDWPEWCYCPVAGAYAIVSGGGSLPPGAGADIASVAGLGAWRATQTIYRFDPAFVAALVSTSLHRLPVESFYRLPEWCVYIEAPDLMWMDKRMAGFFCFLESDANSGHPELRFLIDFAAADPGRLLSVPIHLDHATIGAATQAALEESKRQMVRLGHTHLAATMPESLAQAIADDLQPLLALVLYLCSEEPDIGDGQRGRPAPTKTKKGLKLFPPDAPAVVEVGYKIGHALRDYQLAEQTESAARKGPRPHIRRAHWHTYRTGVGRTGAISRWLPPIPVSLGKGGELPITIKKIR